MDAFTISCTTCQVTLKVRDPSAIGQILTCPKCGSMVLVSPPDTAEVNQTTSEEVPAGMADTAGAPPANPIAPNPNPPKPPQLPPAASMADTVDDLTPEIEGSPPAAPSSLDPSATDEIHSQTILPTDDWASMKSRPWRGRLQIAIAAGVGLLLALMLFGFAATRLSQPKVNSIRDQDLTESRPAPGSLEASNPPTPLADLGEPAVEEPDSPPAKPATPDEEMTPKAEPAVEDSMVSEPRQDERLTSEPEPGEQEEPLDASTMEMPSDETPPGFVPRDSAFTPADRMTGSGSLSEMLHNVQSLLDQANNEQDETGLDSPPGSPPEHGDLPSSDSAEPTYLARPEPRSVNVSERLSDRILEIEFENTALVDVLRLLSDYSTIPITLEPESLVWLKISPDTGISAKLKDVSVAEVMDAALAPLGLVYESAGDQLVVRRQSERREVPFVVKDLVGTDEAQLAKLADWIVRLVAPETWEAAGGSGSMSFGDATLTIEHQEAVLFQVLFFCERLRVARGLRTRSRFDASIFQLIPRTESASDPLLKPITVTFLQATRFTTILRTIESAGEIRLLVDWQALAGAGWNPDAEVTFSAHEQPLGSALAQLLDPMDLSFRIVTDRTLQIVDRDQLSEVRTLEFYLPAAWLPDGSQPAAAVARLQATIGKNNLDSEVEFAADPSSRTLVVLANEPNHRELRRLFGKRDYLGKRD